MRRRILISLTAALFVVSGVPLFGSSAPPARAYPGPNVVLEGAGFGHGRGLGQYGSLGYAIDHGFAYSQILDLFYGGTSSSNIGNPTITVRLVALDGGDTVATSTGGSVSAAGVSAAAVLVRQVSPNSYQVYTGPGCGGPWGLATTVGDPVDITSNSGFVLACATNRAYRGYLQANRDSEGPQRTVNVVAMEDYLKGVVPRESPASWADLGGGAGIHALRAQAVAARSYSYAEGRYSYAKTCDTTACQVYGGVMLNGVTIEDARSNTAIDQTAGEVRVNGGGGVARTEFSSSTGGVTAGGTFPAITDEGDDTSSNPNHRWTAQVPVATIEGAFPEIGGLRTVEVTKRNGFGDWGGRAVEVVLRGTLGDKKITGNDFRSRFGLKSDWFRVVNAASGGVLGYWVMDAIGGVFTFGDAGFHGSVPQLRQQGVRIGSEQIIDVEPTPSGNGYWVLDRAGGIFSFGDAAFFGSIPQLRQQGVRVGPADVIDLAATPSGRGYWLLDGVGGMFAFGDAQFFGSIPQLREQGVSIGRANVVDMTTTPGGVGYVMVDDAGGVFAFGTAPFFGSIPGLRQAGVQIGRATIVGVATTNGGYWMIDDRGGVFAFGSAPFHGSLPGAGISARAAGIAPTKTGNGYLIVTADNGDVHPFGDAPDFGGIPDTGVQTSGRGIAPRYEV
ncbi:MAG TPA: SpoIID/LytB domain-containing protein [Acidimicrobiia bacterium]|nr:SpoIID/LytB domain-containing protein [Acidimicrobiia bacterium]